MTRLTGWKDIANYLGATVRTVQRWEKNESLPVHRHGHAKAHTSFAIPRELDNWLKNRTTGPVASRPAVQANLVSQQDAVIDGLRRVIEDQRRLLSRIATSSAARAEAQTE